MRVVWTWLPQGIPEPRPGRDTQARNFAPPGPGKTGDSEDPRRRKVAFFRGQTAAAKAPQIKA